jgi:FtsP/CotA-like multicopper oxidase with cupredoxin domain
LDGFEIKTAKINRYPNIQNPGNLWYHDHAMRLTAFNVGRGLSGAYILRNPIVEK